MSEAQGLALPVDAREGVTAAVEDNETVEVWEAVGEGSGEGVGVAETQREGRGLRLALALGRAERE